MPYLIHTTLNTGHRSRADRSAVDDATLAVMRPWLDRLMANGQNEPLPIAPLAHFSARASSANGALLLTLFAPAGPHTPGRPALGEIPMVTLGIALRSRHAAGLWPMMVAQFGAAPGIQQPNTPWMAVAVHPSITAYRGDIEWMADFEQCVAWAWITRTPSLEEIK